MPLLPPNTAVNRDELAIPNVGHYYSFAIITGRTPSVSDLVQELRAIPRVDAIRWLCTLSKALLKDSGMTSAGQMHLATQLFPKEWIDKLNQLMKSGELPAGVIFNRRAIWLTFQIAVITCSDTLPLLPNEDVARRVARACFMANDIVSQIEAEYHQTLPTDDTTKWMIAALLPIKDCDYIRPYVELLGRARLLWEEVRQSPQFVSELKRLNVRGLEETFGEKYGIPFREMFQFLVALYVQFYGNQLDHGFTPLLLGMVDGGVVRAFDGEFLERAWPLISQTSDELAISLLRTRQSWTTDVTPMRERPFVEVLPQKCCCPDLTIFLRSVVSRILFLLEGAYDKNIFRSLFGKLFQCYVERLFEEAFPNEGFLRTYLHSPKINNSNDEAADGVLLWMNTAAVMEYKAGLLTTRQRSGVSADEVLKGIDTLVNDNRDGHSKGIPQLVRNLKRLLTTESRVRSNGDLFDLSTCGKVYPVLVVFDEALGFHAVRHYLQEQFNEQLSKTGVDNETRSRLGPLMLFTVYDIEELANAARSVSVEAILAEYARFLVENDKNLTGCFQDVFLAKFDASIDRGDSLLVKRHRAVIRELEDRLDTELPGWREH